MDYRKPNLFTSYSQKPNTATRYVPIPFENLISNNGIPNPVNTDPIDANDTKSSAVPSELCVPCDICTKADVCKYQDSYRLLVTTLSNNSKDLVGDNPFNVRLECKAFGDIEDEY